MTPLKAKILDLIRKNGPITIGQYMQIALTDPEHGYYMRRDPFGAAGDFITAPEVSQIFGELIGLFFVQAWEDRGRPSRFQLVEMGPGRGTLMADMLRAGRIRPEFLAAAEVVLIEASPALRAVQERTLREHFCLYEKGKEACRWVEKLDELDDAPVFLVANEFLDALPSEQLIKRDGFWHLRAVAARGDDLVFAFSEVCVPNTSMSAQLHGEPDGCLIELGKQALDAGRGIAECITRHGGVALIIDYGHTKSGRGDTFQAVKQHAYADPLAEPGEADLTFHVDFEAVAREARSAGAAIFGPATQAVFLGSLGIRERAKRLKDANPQQADDIDAAVHRLTDPQAMGSLFKVLILTEGGPSPLNLPCSS